ncbi:NUDIX hydrolase [Candidatus Woesearchaeota archaeon]|nr:NUDIX hydrolase [Candidatus Woesearchaeota archaeon]
MDVRLWTKIREVITYKGFTSVVHKTFRLPNGKEGTFDISNGRDVASILPLTKRNTVVVVRQYRPGPEMVCEELPGGMIEPGESPLDCITRELAEETGYTGKIAHVATTSVSPYSAIKANFFVATGCERSTTTHLDDLEDVAVAEIPFPEFRQKLKEGKLGTIAGAYLCLDHLGLL